MSRAVVVAVDSRLGQRHRPPTLAKVIVHPSPPIRENPPTEASVNSLTETRPLFWLRSCSWCCGDLTPSVPRVGIRRICVCCGRPEPVLRQDQERRYPQAWKRECA
jgi:hypothetical protein